MTASPLRLVSVGECTIDNYLDLHREYVGGISLNFAVQAARSGAHHVSLVSRIGEDHADIILARLAQESVDNSHVSVQRGAATARQNIVLTPAGDRIFPPGGYHPGVLDGYVLNATELAFVQNHNLLASALFRQIEPLFRQVMVELPFSGWRVADFLDLSDYDRDISLIEQFSERLSIAFVSGDPDLVERLRPLSRASECLIVVTMGVEGSTALIRGEPAHQPALKVENVVDSTGCGDAFQAAFTVSYWNDRDVRRALQRGSEQAASTLSHYGAT